jgi:hypothetical protein
MPHDISSIRTHEAESSIQWPAPTLDVSHIGEACVLRGSGNFTLIDPGAVRALFPGRHVTLDGDVITVWPPPRQSQGQQPLRPAGGSNRQGSVRRP